jgi:hypothetical protein
LLSLFAVALLPSGIARAQGTQTWPPQSAGSAPPPVARAPVQLPELRSGGLFGVGLLLGSRTGLSLKVWPRRPHAITLDLGATPFSNSASLALGYQFHARPLRNPLGLSAQFTLGLGFRTRLLFVAEAQFDDQGEPAGTVVRTFAVLGVRIPFGFSFLVREFPVECFVEVAPAVDVWQSFGVDVEGIGGARVYF